jgi:hypothetical protein
VTHFVWRSKPTAFPKPQKGWVSGGDQSLAVLEAIGGAAVDQLVKDSLEAHINSQSAAWTTGQMGGRGRIQAFFFIASRFLGRQQRGMVIF